MEKSKYKHVQYLSNMVLDKPWRAKVPGANPKNFTTEREAALSVDKTLINLGKKPVNILKRIS